MEPSDLVRCTSCAQRFPSVDYVTRKGRRSPTCSACRKEWAYKNSQGKFKNATRTRCLTCNKMRPNEEFTKSHPSTCFSCTSPSTSQKSPSVENWNSYRSGYRRWH